MGIAVRPSSRQRELLDIVSDATRGCDLATTELVNHCLPQITAYVARRQAAHPEALANLVMAEFVRSLPRLSFASRGQLWSYLYRAANSRLHDERRRRYLEHATDHLEHIEDADPRQADFDDHVVDGMWVADLLSSLTEDQRQVIELRFRDDLTLEETAKRTGKSLTAVKGLQHRALAALAATVAAAAVILLVMSNLLTFRAESITVESVDPADGVTTTLPAPTDTEADLDEPDPERVDEPDDGEIPVADPDEVDGGETRPGPVGDATTTPSPDAPAGGTPSPTPDAETTTPGSPPPVDDPIELDVVPVPVPGPAPIPVPGPIPVPVPEPEPAPGPGPDLGFGPVRAVDDRAVVVFDRTTNTTVVDVIANDELDHQSARVEIAAQPGLGHVEPVAGSTLLRYHSAGAGSDSFDYRVCTDDGCDEASVSVNVSYQTDLCRTAAGGVDPDVAAAFDSVIIGTDGADELTGTAGADLILAGDGNDIIDGLGGDDVICAGGGNDRVFGGDGADVIHGGDGSDTLNGDGGDDVLVGEAGDDNLNGWDGDDRLFGGNGDDYLRGRKDDDVAFGGNGNDEIYTGLGDDMAFGGNGNDVLDTGRDSDLSVGGPGNDGLVDTGGNDRLMGGDGSDVIASDAGDEQVDAGAGTDRCLDSGLAGCEIVMTNGLTSVFDAIAEFVRNQR